MQGGWQPPPGGHGYGAPPGGGYGQPPGPAGPPGYGGPPPSLGYGAAGGGTGVYGSYEFNETENSIIDKTAARAKLWGTISTVIGALQVLSSCGAAASPTFIANLPTGIVAIVVGVAFMGVGNSLKSVVNTQGNDLVHMMQALEKMSGAFMVQIICAIVGFVLTLAAIFIVVFVLVAVAATSN